MTVLLLPLDDRPCNRQFPLQLGRAAGIRVETPPRRLLGWFTRPGQCELLAEWLREKARGAQVAIISADMLCYGGLVASRLPAVSREAALRRLKTLRELRSRNPQLCLFVFTTIPRLAPTLAREQDRQYYQDLLAFAESCGEKGGTTTAARARLGRQAIRDYLAARARNLAVNGELVRLAARGLIDYLVICQDDAAPRGLHLGERRALERAVSERGLSSGRALFLAGADEVGMALLSRAVCGQRGVRPAAAAIYSSPAGRRRVSPFEDRPLEQSVRAHLLCAGAEARRGRKKADFLLFVHNSRGRAARARAGQRVARALEAGEKVAVADVASPNGADPGLAKLLLGRGLAGRLAAYAAWNTAGNTLGTVIAQTCLRLAAPDGSREQAHLEFLLARFIDDYLYQSEVRPRLDQETAKSGCSSLDLGGGWRRAEKLAGALLAGRVGRVAQVVLQGGRGGRRGRPGGGLRLAGWRVHLPWRRTFEIEVQASMSSSSPSPARHLGGRGRPRRRSGRKA